MDLDTVTQLLAFRDLDDWSFQRIWKALVSKGYLDLVFLWISDFLQDVGLYRGFQRFWS